MHIKKQRLLCFVLIILVFISGMCFENIKTEVSAECVSTENVNSYIMPRDVTMVDAEHCTTEMMGIRNGAGIRRLTNGYPGHKRESRTFLEFLYSNIFSLSEGKIPTRFEIIYFLNQNQEELVLKYIHKSDGKKRI